MAQGNGTHRLTRTERTVQILDVAAELVIAEGPAALTMERLADRAQISKALVYLHFQNATEVLAALFHREVDVLGTAIRRAIERPQSPEDKLRAAVRVYLDVVRRRGRILSIAATAPSGRPTDAARVAPRFAAQLFRDVFGLADRPARLAGALFLGSLDGGVDAWLAREVRRADVEDAAVAVGLELADRVARQP